MLPTCLVCQDAALGIIPEYAALPRITSDCKPWPAGGQVAVCGTCGTIQKLPDEKWFEEIGRIYAAYEIYHQSDGAEQVIFAANGAALPRSSVLVDYFVQKVGRHAESGQLIDIGCGNGAALANFSKALPGWSFDGCELSDRSLPALRKIPGFRQLHIGSIDGIAERYDIVSLIHSLEHMPTPAITLKTALALLLPGGSLFVEVPDIETSPFDLLVADHLTHFSRTTLRMLASRVGMQIDVLSNDVLPKELTLLGRHGAASSVRPDPAEGARIVKNTVAWLEAVLAKASDADRAANFGLFGSSISSIWLYGALRDRVKFFVDEDPSRIGRSFDGIPILSPAQVPGDGTVFVPLAKAVVDNVVRRLSDLRVNFILPPAWPA